MSSGRFSTQITPKSLGLVEEGNFDQLPKVLSPATTLFPSGHKDPASFPVIGDRAAHLLLSHYPPFIRARGIWEAESSNIEKVSPSRIVGIAPQEFLPELKELFERQDFSRMFEELQRDRLGNLIRGFTARLSRFISQIHSNIYNESNLSTLMLELPEEPGKDEVRNLALGPSFGAGHLGKELHVLGREIWIAHTKIAEVGEDLIRIDPHWSSNEKNYRALLENILKAIIHVADIEVPREEQEIVLLDAINYSKDH